MTAGSGEVIMSDVSTSESPLLLDIPSTAKKLGITVNAIKWLIRSHAAQYRKIGRKIFFTLSDIEHLIDQSKVVPTKTNK